MGQLQKHLIITLVLFSIIGHVAPSERFARENNDETGDQSVGGMLNSLISKLSKMLGGNENVNSTAGNGTTNLTSTSTQTGSSPWSPTTTTTISPLAATTARSKLTSGWSGTFFLTSTSTEDERCYSEAYLQDACEVPDELMDVSFWDLYSEIFSDTVVDALLVSCPKGVWCLQDRFDYWMALIMERVDMVMNAAISDSMCRSDALQCMDITVNNFIACPSYPKMEYTADAIRLICHLKQNPDLTEMCFKHVISALHVTLADILRQESGLGQYSDDTCQTPEVHMTKCLICMTNSCPGEIDVINGFGPWSWFTSVVDEMIETCELDPNKCEALMPPNASLVYQSELSTMIGVSVATMVTAVMMVIVVCLCYKRHRRQVVLRDGYEKLLTEGDES